MKRLGVYLSLIRVHNCLIASLAVAVGQFLTTSSSHMQPDRYAMAIAFFVCGFGNIINDILDLESDRINHPRRALPSGKLSIADARTLSFIFLAISLVLLWPLNTTGRLIAILALILLLGYNFWFKHTRYIGNIVVSFLGSLAFLLGGAVANIGSMLSLPGPIIPALFAFLMHFGREIIKDIEDIAGDAAFGSETAPVKTGTGRPLFIALFSFSILMISSIAVYIPGWFNNIYLTITLTLVVCPMIVQSIWLMRNPDRRTCRIIGLLVKLEMLPGILALVLGKNY